MHISVRDMREIIEFNLDNKIKRSCLFLGPSGVGKSAVVQQICKDRGIGFIDLRLLLMDETSLRGVPYPNKDRTKTIWLQNDIFPDEARDGARGILCIEEITSASRKVQAAAYQLIHDYKLGNYSLPEGWYIVALGNRETDEGVYVQMPAPLTNRFEIHEVYHSLDIWKSDFAYKEGISQKVISYLNFKPSALHTFSPDSNGSLVFASPRSWEAVSNILNSMKTPSLSNRIVYAKVAGNIGEIEASSFKLFLEKEESLGNIADILEGKPFDIPSNDSTVYLIEGGIISLLSSELKRVSSMSSSEKGVLSLKVSRAIEFFLRLKPEFTVVGVSDLCSLNKSFVASSFMSSTSSAKVSEFFKKYKYLFQ